MAKKKRGRPKGSRNKPYEVTEEVPAACVKCGESELTVMPGYKSVVRGICGRLRDGREFEKVKWTRKKCKNCGQILQVRKYFLKNNKDDNFRGVDSSPTSGV